MLWRQDIQRTLDALVQAVEPGGVVAQPNENGARLLVDAAHEPDLLVLFRYVLLVDADGVGPEDPDSILLPKAFEGRVEAVGY
jgi:hypothetical protein